MATSSLAPIAVSMAGLFRWTKTQQLGPVMRLESDGKWWQDDGDGKLRKVPAR